MQEDKPLNEDALNYVRRIVAPIFKESLQEPRQNRMMVGSGPKNPKKHCLYSPHNYRLYIDFSRAKFKPSKPTSYLGWSYPLVVNSTERNSKKGHWNIRIKKNQMEITRSLRDWYTIKMWQPVKPEFSRIVKGIDSECIDIAKEFIQVFGGKSKFNILRRRGEHKIKGEDAIDEIPTDHIFYNSVGKKVYHQNVFEFKSPIHASNYIENSGLREYSPIIAEAIDRQNPLRFLKLNIMSLTDLYIFKPEISLLSSSEAQELNIWLINTFGVSA